MKIKTQNKDAKNIVFISMKKIIFLMLLIAIALACNVSAANLYNYVYNGTSWIPMISTDDGQQKLWIEMKNCSYGSVQNDLYVDGKIGIGTTSPGQELEVVGTGNFTTELYVAEQQVCREDGTNCPAGANESGNITAVTGASPITSTGGATPEIGITMLGDLATTSPITGAANDIFPGSDGAKATIAINDASTSQKGAVQLENSTSSTSITTAATPYSVKAAYDLANSKLSAESDTLATVTARGNTTTQNITIGNKLTFALNEFIDNLVNGWLRITGSLNITGDLNVIGNITGGSPVKIKGGLNVLNASGTTHLYVNDTTGYIGIGTTAPAANMEIAGGIKIGNDTGACDAAKAGTIRWDGNSFQGCNGLDWLTLENSPPTLSSVSPVNGSILGGYTITLTGSSFVTPVTVTIGGVSATDVTVVSATSITATVPASESIGAKDVVVTNPDGLSSTLAGGFTYLFYLTSVSPVNGSAAGGYTINLTGNGFDASANVTIGGVSATDVTVINGTFINATVPASGSIGAKDVVVTNPNGLSDTLTDGFTYLAYATGGTITYDGDYKIHTFLSSGQSFTVVGGSITVEVLVVAGGGGGGYVNSAGGGGGGGVVYNSSHPVTAQAYTITVGAGGASGSSLGSPYQAGSGSNSVFDSITATGGGGGGSYLAAALNGGSGGGAGNPGTGGTGTAGQGYDGGGSTGGAGNGDGGGGGGGASAVGSAGTTSVGGNGGDGSAYSISGTSTYYGGGGGGGRYTGSPGTGGAGGGGAGGSSSAGGSGTANTGGGGGGSGATASGGGGSGIVIIRYPISVSGGGNGDGYDPSDERLKENFASLDNDIAKLQILKPISFNMIGESPSSIQLGFTAQNVQKVYPELVRVIDVENGYLGLNYKQLTAPIISALNQVTRTINLADAPSNASSITIDKKGNVGVGTTSPDSKLEVNGEVHITDTITGSNAGTDLCIDANGRICQCGSCA